MMGRKRKHRKDLPERMYFNHGSYYYGNKNGTWDNLGRDLNKALKKYADIVTSPVPGRMSEIMDLYMKEWAPFNKRPRTIKNNEKELIPLKTAFGHMEPEEITPTFIYQYMDQRPKVAANREVALLSSVFKFAIRKGAASTNPCKFVSRNTERPRDRQPTNKEYETVYNFASPAIQCAMELARQTGLREGDILSLNERENVREDGLFAPTSKTGKKLLFTWTDELRSLVDRCRAIRPESKNLRLYLVCNRQGQRYTEDGFRTEWSKAVKKAVQAGMEPFQFRDIRSLAADLSESPTELLGHDDPKVTNRVYRRAPRKVKPNA